jgi:hypothetical protein
MRCWSQVRKVTRTAANDRTAGARALHRLNRDHLIMSFVHLEGEDAAWAQPPKEPGDIVKDAIKKEQMIMCVASPKITRRNRSPPWNPQGNNLCARGSSRLVADRTIAPEGCSHFLPIALLARVKAVQADVDKLSSGNETLQMYVDNLKLQVVKQR